MQSDFHYYATYCAAWLAGYSHEECMEIAYSAQLVDCCTKSMLSKIGGPLAAATTQSRLELMDERKDIIGLQDITRIWASFHFLPFDLNADKRGCSKRYLDKYRLLCNVNGDLLKDTVELAKGGPLQAVGLAMHVLADTWAHRYFAGTPSHVINNTNLIFYEVIEEGGSVRERKISFRHSPSAEDDIQNGIYVCTPFQGEENSVMDLGHGRAGHLPDYSFIRYRYVPAWGGYHMITKDNPADYMSAFCQMIYAMKYLRGQLPAFEKGVLDREAAAPWKEEIQGILKERRKDASEGWRRLGEELSGRPVEAFDEERYQEEYVRAKKEDRRDTFLGRFFLAAMGQKSMVTNKIFKSGNMLAGFSIDFDGRGFKGIRDYFMLVQQERRKMAR